MAHNPVPVVWTYWEGQCPDYIKLCLENMQQWCNAEVLDRAGFDRLWKEDRDVDIDRLYVAHRADFIRVYLLRHYGGAWIDADCVVLNSIDPLVGHLANHDLVYYREPTGTVSNNFLIAEAQTPVICCYYDSVTAHLRAQRPIDWLEIGSIPLAAAIEQHVDAVHMLETETIMPISWNESQRFLENVPREALEEASRGKGNLHNTRSFCYMLCNHSMPEAVKSMSRDEIIDQPMFLSYLFRVTQSAASMSKIAPNYRYWRQPEGDWGSEYDRRKTRHAYYHIQEMMITDHIAHHAPCRVLEWGCGTGRHLNNLARLPGVEVFGFDQSQSMLDMGFKWATAEWRASHLAVGDPTEGLPYDNGAFDIVFTCEALLHTRPEDLEGRLSELARVCRGHILHIESPPSWAGYSPSCEGCWGHDLIAAYNHLDRDCEILTSGFSHQAPYLVKLNPASVRWQWSAAMLSIYQRLDRSLEDGFAQTGMRALAS